NAASFRQVSQKASMVHSKIRIPLACVTALLVAIPCHALSVTIQPSPAGPQPVGTTIVWTAASTGADQVTYRFSAGPMGGAFHVLRDFSRSPVFEWTPLDDGNYAITVTARNSASGSWVDATAFYGVYSRVVAGTPLVTLTSNALVALYSAPGCDSGSMRVRFTRSGTTAGNVTPWKACQPGHDL